jgi:hypothetical protein
MMHKDFEDLLAAWLNHEDLPADRQAVLLRRLEDDEEFRTEFSAEIQMQGLTRAAQAAEPRWLLLEELLEHDEEPAAEERQFAFEERVAAEISRVEFQPPWFSWGRWLGLAFGALAIWGGSMFLAFQHGQNTSVAELPPATVIVSDGPDSGLPEGAVPVAVLARSANARWNDGRTDLQNGAMLSPGRLAIEDGLAQVDFIGGAQVILRGPAELDLRSSGEARLIRGQATCRVSEQAKGFRFSATGLDIIDSAGVFGVEVKADGPAELHAIDGNVSLRDAAGAARELIESTAIRLADKSFQAVSYKPDFFPNLNELKRLEQEAVANRSVDWYDHSLRWSAEPETLLYYTFMSDVYQEQRLENLAPRPDRLSHGIVIGGRWSEGRWPWKKALEFRKRTDRVLLGLPGQHPRLTLATWLRVDAFTQSRNILLRSKQADRWTVSDDGQIHDNPQHLPERGEIRWELDRTGVISFKVATGSQAVSERWDIAATPRVIKDDQLSQWALLTTTYDSGSGAVVHYWNGKPVSKSMMTDATPLAFEFLELGNPNLSDDELKEGQRYGFFGALGELMISRRILNETEIAEFYLAGKPAS